MMEPNGTTMASEQPILGYLVDGPVLCPACNATAGSRAPAGRL